jgi:hypothetical protein
MRILARRDFGAALAVLAGALGWLVWATTYPTKLATVPALVAGLTAVLALMDVAAQTESRAGRWVRRLMGQGADTPDEAAAPRLVMAACAWPVAYAAAVAAVGFLAATPLYVLLYMRLHGRRSTAASAVAAVAVTAAIWLTFQVLFRYPLFRGVLFGGAL